MTVQAQFLTGNIMRHVISMTATSALGLIVLFLVDLVDMYFLSLLGEVELAAAVGYSGSILFFTTSASIGVSIAAGALVARSIGEADQEKAQRYAINVYLVGVLFGLILATLVWLNIPLLVSFLGASGRTHQLATQYLQIIIPSMPILMLAMCSASMLRAVGAAKLSMYTILCGGIVNAVFDPIFIFLLDLGIQGAALASVLGRIVMMGVGLYAALKLHNLVVRFDFRACIKDLPDIVRIAFPAILTNVATPIGNAYVTATMAGFGDSAVAAMSVIGRVIPVAFGAIFALSGAVGPIIGQNFGARKFDRVVRALHDSMIFTCAYVLVIACILFATRQLIPEVFSLTGDARGLVIFFCSAIALSFIFNGAQFVANAAFNNLGYPKYSTISNFSKATIGTIPFVSAGAMLAGAQGVLVGQALGSVIFGSLSYWYCMRLIKRTATGEITSTPKKVHFMRRFPLWPYSNNR